MTTYLLLAGFGIVGFIAWKIFEQLWAIGEENIPPAIKSGLYTTIKNLPTIVLSFVFVSLFWLSLGAIVLRFALSLFGLQDYLPDTSWAIIVVTYFVFVLLLSLWGSPTPPDPVPPRGRDLSRAGRKQAPPTTPSPKTPAPNTRGRTIRSYHDNP